MKNIIKHNLKQKIWLTACVTLLFILCKPMMQIVTYENESRYALFHEDLVKAMEQFFLPDIFSDFVPTIIACVVIAIMLFSYLFSKRRVDLYHSIPVDRKHLFMASYVSGIIIYLCATLIEVILCFAIAIPNHYMTGTAFANMIACICVNLVHFLFGYSVVICAVMLSGNMVVAVMGAAVLGLIYPVVTSFIDFFKNYYYVTHTVCTKIDKTLLEKNSWLSPIISYAKCISRTQYSWYDLYYESVNKVYLDLIAPILMTVLLTGIAYYLYSKRPSEAAGHALAFKKTRIYIEMPIVVIGGLIGAWFMCTSINTYKTSWVWFGIVLGVLLTHFFLEAVLNESFKSILSHKLQLAVTLVITMAFVGLFYGDVTKFDTYIPDRDKIQSASIYFENIDNELTAMEFVEDSTNKGYYNTNYIDPLYSSLSAELTDKATIDKIYGISQIGVMSVPDMIEEKKGSNEDSYYRYDMAYEEKVMLDDKPSYAEVNGLSKDEAYNQALKWMEENGIHEINRDENVTTYITICYRLKNGKAVLRQYSIPLSKVYSAMDTVYRTEDYKEGHFTINKTFNEGAIYKTEVYDCFGNRVVSLTEKEKDELLKVYISELKKLNFDIISNMPIGRISPLIKVSDMYDETLPGYYIYPEFTQTLALIESYGVDMSGFTSEINEDELLSIVVSSYNLYGYSDDNSLYVDDITYDMESTPEIIKDLAPKLINSNYIWSNNMLIANKTRCDFVGIDMSASMIPVKGIQRNFGVILKDGKIPENIKKDIVIRIWEENQY